MARISLEDDGGYQDPGGGGGSASAPVSYSAPGYQAPFENGGFTGYGRGVPTPPIQQNNPYVFNQSAFEKAFGEQTAGKSGTLAEWQNSIFPSLQQLFPDIQSFGSKGDKIRLPNGQVIDAVLSAGAGGRGYGLNYVSGGSDYYNDPLLQGFLNFGQGAIDRLMGPQEINPTLQHAIDALTNLSNAPAPSLDLGSILAPLQAAVTKRQAQIDQPGYSPSQLDLMRTQVTDPLEAQRSAAHQQILQRFAAQGMTPDSGIVQQALLDADRAFSQQRTTGERGLAQQEIAQDEARKQEAVQLAQLLSQMNLSGSQANLSAASAGRGQNLSAASQLAGVGSQLQDEPMRNLLSAMGIYGNMAQLPFQSEATQIAAMNAINGQQVPQDNGTAQIISLLMGLANQGENVFQDTQQNGNNFWNVLGQALPDILKSFGGLFGHKNAPNTGTGGGPAGPLPGGQY